MIESSKYVRYHIEQNDRAASSVAVDNLKMARRQDKVVNGNESIYEDIDSNKFGHQRMDDIDTSPINSCSFEVNVETKSAQSIFSYNLLQFLTAAFFKKKIKSKSETKLFYPFSKFP